MSEVKTDKISPMSAAAMTVGDSGDTFTVPSGATLTVASGATLTVSGTLDINGIELILDADADTSITADTDDTIDIKIAGADDFQFTANSFNVLSGSTLTIDSGATLTNSGTATGFGSSIGQQTIWVPAAAMEAAVTTAAATSNAVEIGTSLFAARTMDFATDADDFAYFGIQMPKSWDAGTLVCQFVWSATGANANTVLWAIAATSLGDDEVLTTAFPAPTSPAADTNSTTADDIMISAEVTVTVGSTPTAEDYVMFEVSRDVSGDTLAEDARLHGIKIHYTTDAGSDS